MNIHIHVHCTLYMYICVYNMYMFIHNAYVYIRNVMYSVHVHAYVYMYIHIHVYTCTLCMYMYSMYAPTVVFATICADNITLFFMLLHTWHTCIYIITCTYYLLYTCMYMYVHVYMYVHIIHVYTYNYSITTRIYTSLTWLAYIAQLYTMDIIHVCTCTYVCMYVHVHVHCM